MNNLLDRAHNEVRQEWHLALLQIRQIQPCITQRTILLLTFMIFPALSGLTENSNFGSSNRVNLTVLTNGALEASWTCRRICSKQIPVKNKSSSPSQSNSISYLRTEGSNLRQNRNTNAAQLVAPQGNDKHQVSV